jgi:hypothetical protein
MITASCRMTTRTVLLIEWQANVRLTVTKPGVEPCYQLSASLSGSGWAVHPTKS